MFVNSLLYFYIECCIYDTENISRYIYRENMRRRHNYSNLHDLFTSVVNGSLQELESYVTNAGNVNLAGPDGATLLLQVQIYQ